MEDYKYHAYSSAMVVRVGKGTTERLTIDGTWKDYPYRWEVLAEGRLLENEKNVRMLLNKYSERVCFQRYILLNS